MTRHVKSNSVIANKHSHQVIDIITRHQHNQSFRYISDQLHIPKSTVERLYNKNIQTYDGSPKSIIQPHKRQSLIGDSGDEAVYNELYTKYWSQHTQVSRSLILHSIQQYQLSTQAPTSTHYTRSHQSIEPVTHHDTVDRFMKKYNLIQKKAKHKHKPLSANDTTERDNFFTKYNELKQKYSKHLIINMDETRLNDMYIDTTTIVPVGMEPLVMGQGKETSDHGVTLVCAVAMDGSKLPIYAIKKGKTYRTFIQYTSHSDLYFINNPHTSFVNEQLMIDWLSDVLLLYTSGKPVLLLVDNFAAHTTPAVLNFAGQNNITILPLPPRQTDKYQPLDVGIFGPVKSKLRATLSSMRQSTGEHKLHFTQTMEQFYQAWRNTTSTTIRHAFHKASLQ